MRLPKTTKKTRKKYDRYEVYEFAVQDPEHLMDYVAKTFRRLRRREGHTLREDFCGTGANSAAWVLRGPANRAVGIDLDPEPLAYGRKKRFAPGTVAASRTRMIRGSVLDAHRGLHDIVIAFNFSWMVLRTREEVLEYFALVRRALKKDGLFFLDLYGGPDSQRKTLDHSLMGPLSYYWEQKEWDAITGETKCAIHLKPRGDRKRMNEFTYHWRLWTLAETLDLLRESGLAIVEVQDEISTSVARGASVYKPVKRLLNSESFVAHVIAGRGK